MNAVRTFLAVLWLLFGLTATAHASSLRPGEPPCHHMAAAASHSSVPTAPRDDQTVMPCCNQPVLIAPAEIAIPQSTRLRPIRMGQETVLTWTGQIPAFEPKPPKSD